MKNIIKNILLLGCLMGSASDLFSMNILGMFHEEPARTSNISRVRREVKAPETSSRATVATKNPYYQFIGACQGNDGAEIKAVLASGKISEKEIILACGAIDKKNNDALFFILPVLDFAVSSDKTELVQFVVKNYVADSKKLIAVVRDHFEKSALAGNAEMTECLLDSCTSLITEVIDDKFFMTVVSKVASNKDLQHVQEKLTLEREFRQELSIAAQEVAQLSL